MADVNTVVLVGRLTRDAELKYTNSGMAICEFALAINTRRKQGEEWVDEANFFDITLFGRQGEAIQRYMTKGKQVAVEGRLKQDRWQNNEGQNRSKVAVIANNVMLLGGPGEGGGGDRGGASDGAPRGGASRGPAPRPQGGGRSDNFDDSQFEDEVPF